MHLFQHDLGRDKTIQIMVIFVSSMLRWLYKYPLKIVKKIHSQEFSSTLEPAFLYNINVSIDNACIIILRVFASNISDT